MLKENRHLDKPFFLVYNKRTDFNTWYKFDTEKYNWDMQFSDKIMSKIKFLESIYRWYS